MTLPTSTFLPGLEVSASRPTRPASAPLPTVRSTPSPIPCTAISSQTVPTSATSPGSTGSDFEKRMAFLWSLRAECLASLHRRSDSCAELMTNVGCGPSSSEWVGNFDPHSSLLRTRQVSLALMTDGHGTELCLNFPRSGMTVGGMFFPLPRLVQGISENGCSSYVPTLKASRSGPDFARATRITKSGRKPGKDDLVTYAAKLLPTCTARDYKDTPGMARVVTGDRVGPGVPLPRLIYGDASQGATGGTRLAAEFLCWLMGYPLGWWKPIAAALAMLSSHKSRCRSSRRSKQRESK